MRPVVQKGNVIFFFCTALVILSSTSGFRCLAAGDTTGKKLAPMPAFSGVQALATRRVPWLAPHLVFRTLGKTAGQPGAKDGKEQFEISTKDGIVQIAASGPNA